MSNNEWPLPNGLSTSGRRAAEAIHEFLATKDLEYHGGGGRFYSPAQWRDRGERYGLSSLLIVTHDGGDHAGAFNLDYEQYALNNELTQWLRDNGFWMEQCTSWYTAIYALTAGS